MALYFKRRLLLPAELFLSDKASARTVGGGAIVDLK